MRRALLAVVVLALVVAAIVRYGPTPPAAPEPLHTRHLNADGTPAYTNRLAHEASPYLRQHAHNPVDWYPWGDEAFAKARSERKPILLSVGYSTCHWCHVMAEESFEDDEIAAYLNAHYVAIKVDREERPDVDAVYMSAVQLMSDGGGGWPMTVWLTPERRPFYAGTYFPPRAGARGARFGFLELLTRLAERYASDPATVEAAATDVVGRLAATATPATGAAPDASAMQHAFAEVAPGFDREHGGFGSRPKFPQPSQLLFLLRYGRRSGDPAPLDMVLRTLDGMAAGGIHDHLAGGFHRYATDVAWRVPHYERMLYDNALLAVVYLEASQASARADLADVARGVLGWLEREMRAPGGGFFAATDADSDGEEGSYFLWSRAQLEQALDPERAAFAAAWFDVGNEPTTLATPRPLDAVAASLGMTPEAARVARDAVVIALRDARNARVAPHVDHKVVVSWNGLAVSAFARAAAVLRDEAPAARAIQTANVLLRARRGDRLPRYLMDGAPHGEGYLDDYAFLEAGLLDLYETTFDARWLREAVALQAVLDAHFADTAGGYFLTADDHEVLLTREKPDYDGAEPTGNSVALQNLLRLAELTGDDAYRTRADGVLGAFAAVLAARPSALAHMLCGLDFRAGPVKEIVLASPSDDAAALAPLLDVLARAFLPRRVLAATGTAHAVDATLVPLVAEKEPLDGKPTAFVCERRTCKAPTNDPRELAKQLE